MKYDEAYRDYKRGMAYKKIAEKYGVALSTVKSWKARHWNAKEMAAKGIDPKTGVKRKHGGQPGNKNAKGHGAPIKNGNAIKHGLFAKYLPQETIAIIEDIRGTSALDILWANIQLKFAAIVRAQKLLFVETAEDHLRYSETSSSISTDPGSGQKKTVSKKEYVITAIEREEKFLHAQSRAMDTLARMIKQYEEMAEGSLATEEQKMRIAKLKVEVESVRHVSMAAEEEHESSLASYVDALRGEVSEVWSDEEVESTEEE